MSRVVTLTPLAVDQDSRAVKQAASMSRLGYDSVVVEFLRSEDGAGLPFRLCAVATPELTGAVRALPARRRRLPDGGGPPPPRRKGGLIELLRTLNRLRAFVLAFFRRFGWDTLRATPDGQLYYLHSYLQFPAVYLRCRKRRLPFIYDARDFYPSFASHATFEERMESRFREWVEAACVKHAAEVVTVSPGVADLIEERYGRRPAVIRNCADLRLDEPAETDVRQAAGLADDDFLIVFVGNAKPGLAFDEALAAIERLPARVQLSFVGAGYEEHEEEVRRRGLGGRVHFLPLVKPIHVTAVIRSADLAAIPYHGLTSSYVHMLPNGFFHAVAAGLPILYPDLPDVRALAAEYDLGLPIDASDPDSIIAQVSVLLGDPARLDAYRTNAELARETLNWEHEERRLAQLVRRALEGR
jgi:glycosyltransferase involved in cell wall biosynthesis